MTEAVNMRRSAPNPGENYEIERSQPAHSATKELSQDAMICWLIDWANPRNGILRGNRCE